jgi:hypothetical protein
MIFSPPDPKGGLYELLGKPTTLLIEPSAPPLPHDPLGQVDWKSYGWGTNCVQHILLCSDYLFVQYEVIKVWTLYSTLMSPLLSRIYDISITSSARGPSSLLSRIYDISITSSARGPSPLLSRIYDISITSSARGPSPLLSRITVGTVLVHCWWYWYHIF